MSSENQGVWHKLERQFVVRHSAKKIPLSVSKVAVYDHGVSELYGLTKVPNGRPADVA
jgi:hypothetical protein